MTNKKNKIRISKFLSMILRHSPETVGVALEPGGWVSIDFLLKGMKKTGTDISREFLQEIVDTDEKQRYEIDRDKIRAAQGHSADVDMQYEKMIPPDILYHGTSTKNLDSIFKTGLISSSRQFVHLSLDEETAMKVGSRHGKPIILQIGCEQMYKDNYEFFCAKNGVWLTKAVPAKYLSLKGNVL